MNITRTNLALPVFAVAATAVLLGAGPFAAIADDLSDQPVVEIVDRATQVPTENVALIHDAESTTAAVDPTAATEAVATDSLVAEEPSVAEVPADQPPAEFTALTGDIVGMVTDVHANPIEGAAVRIQSAQYAYDYLTGADGLWYSGELQPGTFSVFVQADGFISEYWDDSRSPYEATNVVIEAGQRETTETALSRATSLYGSVHTLNGSPAVDMRVRVYADAPNAAGSAIKTVEADGSVQFDLLHPTSYYVEVTDALDEHLGWWDGDASLSGNPVALIADETGTALHFSVVLGLVDEDTQPGDDGDNPPVEHCTDASGTPIECGELPDQPDTDTDTDTEQPTTSTPQDEEPTGSSATSSERLAFTGSSPWSGAVVIAGALLLVGAVSHLSMRVHARRQLR